MNYLIDNLENDAELTQQNLEILDAKLTNIFTRLNLFDKWQKVINEKIADMDRLHNLQNQDIVNNLNAIQERRDNKVDKQEGKDIVCVDDVMDGTLGCVPTIASVRREIEAINNMTMISGETSNTDAIFSCDLKVMPIEILTFTLGTGHYALDGFIRHLGESEAIGKFYFEVGGEILANSAVTFSGNGNAPISALISLNDEVTEVKLMTSKVSGTHLEIVSNERNKSYARYIRIIK